MLTLLEDEQLISDLSSRPLQSLTDQILSTRTIILTNKRLVLIDRKMGSYKKEYIFLQDVQGLSSVRRFNIIRLIVDILVWMVAVDILWNSVKFEGGGLIPGIVAGALGLVLAFTVVKYGIVVATSYGRFELTVERRLAVRFTEGFLDQVQQHMAKVKPAGVSQYAR